MAKSRYDKIFEPMMNAFESGIEDKGITVEDGKAIAKIYEAAGADSLHVRMHWAGMHQGSFHHNGMFYPEPHIPLSEFPREMDWSRKGALANVPLPQPLDGKLETGFRL